ncbi:hypothetical protein [Dictyobacter formicarum]|uniref:DUF2569 domain-containing protein n=1 Tax=Dictyobacter formicarum TaxID=2778368 RepID=A0ABQ3VUN5_9CHLR|nr:hypothetical protein [Dictyobacter formicarum]GHO89404.1 hypothetical protein KSZ_74100 [Dictyobacter formicarum]
MKEYWYAGDNTRVTRWLYIIMAIFWLWPATLSGVIEALHMGDPFPNWLNYFLQCIGWFCWGLASLMVVIARHRRKPHVSVYTQPRLWFGLIGFTLIPDAAILGLENSHMLSASMIPDVIQSASVIASLICLIVALYFWVRNQRRVDHKQKAQE